VENECSTNEQSIYFNGPVLDQFGTPIPDSYTGLVPISRGNNAKILITTNQDDKSESVVIDISATDEQVKNKTNIGKERAELSNCFEKHKSPQQLARIVG
jgi:hypothetical protein